MIEKVIMSGGWGYGNIGDEAILKYTYLDISKIFPSDQIVILSFDPQQTKYHHGIEAKECIHKLLKSANNRNFETVALNIINGKKMPDTICNYADQFDKNTLFVMAGGGYFNDLWMESFYSHLCEIVIAKSRGAKVAIIGQTIGPIGNGKNRTLFNKIVNMVDYVDVRDKTSYEFLRSLLPDKEIHKSCDSVIRNGEQFLSNVESKQIGIMFQRKRPYTGPDSTVFNYRARQGIQLLLGESKKFEESICDLIKTLKKLYPEYRIVFVQSTNWNEDKIKRIMMKSGADSVIFDNQVDDYLVEISKLRLVITTNMHPAIIATSIGIPAIAISHTYKIDDYMNSVSMGRYTYHDINTSDILSNILELLDNRDIKNELMDINRSLNEMLNETYHRLHMLCE